MYFGYTFIEIIILYLAIDLLLSVLIAFLDIELLNNFILKTKGENKVNSIISNKEGWKAGYKVFKFLLVLGILGLLFLFTYTSIEKEEWLINFFKIIFLLILGYSFFKILFKGF